LATKSKRYTDSFRKRSAVALPKTIVPNPRSTAVCGSCGAVYERKRWFEDAARSRELRHDLHVDTVKCPACVRAKANLPEGILTASGAFLHEHHDEILHTIVATAKRERARDTLCRLIGVQMSPDGIVVKTANERLARKLGHVLHAAFHGELNFVFSHDDRLTRVRWHRDELGHQNHKRKKK
jgi:NMD protein affecting ribosome stability and mRNA decay